MTCVPAPACKAVLVQASARWPKRSKASDGICPSAAHTSANPTSDHERGNAVDLTHDPANGCDAHGWAEELRRRRDPRVKYVISARRIYNPAISPEWRAYSGSNPHQSHVHVSILPGARDDTSPWFRPMASTSTPLPTPPEDDEMTDAERALLQQAAQKANDAVNYAVDAQQRLHNLEAKLDQLLARS